MIDNLIHGSRFTPFSMWGNSYRISHQTGSRQHLIKIFTTLNALPLALSMTPDYVWMQLSVHLPQHVYACMLIQLAQCYILSILIGRYSLYKVLCLYKPIAVYVYVVSMGIDRWEKGGRLGLHSNHPNSCIPTKLFEWHVAYMYMQVKSCIWDSTTHGKYLIDVNWSMSVHPVSPWEIELPLGQRHCGRNDASGGTTTREFSVANWGTWTRISCRWPLKPSPMVMLLMVLGNCTSGFNMWLTGVMAISLPKWVNMVLVPDWSWKVKNTDFHWPARDASYVTILSLFFSVSCGRNTSNTSSEV